MHDSKNSLLAKFEKLFWLFLKENNVLPFTLQQEEDNQGVD